VGPESCAHDEAGARPCPCPCPSVSQSGVYEADGAAEMGWRLLAVQIVARVVLIAAPLQVVVMVLSNTLAEWLRQRLSLSLHAGLASLV
jgi:hypothetical protein